MILHTVQFSELFSTFFTPVEFHTIYVKKPLCICIFGRIYSQNTPEYFCFENSKRDEKKVEKKEAKKEPKPKGVEI